MQVYWNGPNIETLSHCKQWTVGTLFAAILISYLTKNRDTRTKSFTECLKRWVMIEWSMWGQSGSNLQRCSFVLSLNMCTTTFNPQVKIRQMWPLMTNPWFHTISHLMAKTVRRSWDRYSGAVGVKGDGERKTKRLIYFRPGNLSWTHNVSDTTCVFTCHRDSVRENSGALSGGDELERNRDRWNQLPVSAWLHFTDLPHTSWCVGACRCVYHTTLEGVHRYKSMTPLVRVGWGLCDALVIH